MILTPFYPLFGHWVSTLQAARRCLNAYVYECTQDTLPATVPACLDVVRSPAAEVIVCGNGFMAGT